jgi:hypothetical protein
MLARLPRRRARHEDASARASRYPQPSQEVGLSNQYGPPRDGEARGGRHTLAGTNDDMLARANVYRRRFGAMHRGGIRRNTQDDQQA